MVSVRWLITACEVLEDNVLFFDSGEYLDSWTIHQKLVDDLPPETVITSMQRQKNGSLLVRGTTSDNGEIKRVIVNGSKATSVRANFAEWEASVPSAAELRAFGEDVAGNTEPKPHILANPL